MFFLRNSLLFSLLLSLSSSQTTTETRKESTPQQQTAKRSTFFEDHHREGKELLKNSLLFFVHAEKNSKITVVTERKSAEKQPTPLMNTFALVVFITSPRHSLQLHARAT